MRQINNLFGLEKAVINKKYLRFKNDYCKHTVSTFFIYRQSSMSILNLIKYGLYIHESKGKRKTNIKIQNFNSKQ